MLRVLVRPSAPFSAAITRLGSDRCGSADTERQTTVLRSLLHLELRGGQDGFR